MTEALDVLSALVLEDGHRWGEVAQAIQWADAEAVLDPTCPAPYHFLTRARGYSKTTDLGGMAVAAMLTQLGPAARLYALAADLATAPGSRQRQGPASGCTFGENSLTGTDIPPPGFASSFAVLIPRRDRSGLG